MDLDLNYEDMLEHVCGFCNKIFKKEVKLDKHIKEKHQLHPETEQKEEEQGIKSVDTDIIDEVEQLEVKSEPLQVMDAKIKKMPERYNNLYKFDPVNMIWICGSCGSNFYSDRGMSHHLNVTVCGFGSKTGYKPKLSYKSLYVKDAGQIICCGCGSAYQSERGMHYHLKLTTCGFGTKEKSPPKKDYTPFYKVENNIHICLGCGVSYDNIRVMHYHLQKKCGANAQPKLFSPKPGAGKEGLKNSPAREKKNFKNYKQFYRKTDDSTFVCLGCETVYRSSNGVHSHLNITKCGFGDKFRSPPKTCYLQLYRREGAQFVCLGCGRIYESSTGIHHHLNNTSCGFGDKETGSPRSPRRNYTSFYYKEEEIYKCKGCAFTVPYMRGMHRHIEKCVAGVLEESNTLGKQEGEVLKKAQDEVGDLFKAYREHVEKINTLSKADNELVKSHVEDEFADMMEEVHPPDLGFNFMDVPLD